MGFWSVLLTIYAVLTAAIALIGAWTGGLWFAVCVLGASFLAPAAAGGFKAAFFGGDRTMKIAASIIALAVLGLAYWLSQKFEARIFGFGMSGTYWAIIGALLGYVFAEKGETYYLPEPGQKPVTR